MNSESKSTIISWIIHLVALTVFVILMIANVMLGIYPIQIAQLRNQVDCMTMKANISFAGVDKDLKQMLQEKRKK